LSQQPPRSRTNDSFAATFVFGATSPAAGGRNETMAPPRLTRLLVATMAIGLVLPMVACGPAPGPASAAASDLRARTDSYRAANGRSPLTLDGYLEGNAQLHADRLAAGATDCSNLWHSTELSAWYAGSWAAENVGCDGGCPADAARVFSMWRASPSHNPIMSDATYGLTGVGVTCNGTVEIVVAHYRSP
jgi:uncharacterized protein YkwD